MANNNNTPPNVITIPILVAFILSAAIFSSLATLLVTWLVLQRRRRLKRRRALIRAKRKTASRLIQDPETPPMRTNSMFPPSLVVSPLYNQPTPKSTTSPSSIGSPESGDSRGQYTPMVQAIPPRKPIEMMGSTTWSKSDMSPETPLMRAPSVLQTITAAITEERPRTGQ